MYAKATSERLITLRSSLARAIFFILNFFSMLHKLPAAILSYLIILRFISSHKFTLKKWVSLPPISITLNKAT